MHFYSHIPCGMWRNFGRGEWGFDGFLLTHPVWDVTFPPLFCLSRCWFLLTHPVWDVTQTLLYRTNWQSISTHTSRVGCDMLMATRWRRGIISTHTSRVGCDFIFFHFVQSHLDFYSHIPCGMWLQRQIDSGISSIISTHTSRVGCDRHPARRSMPVPISTHTSRVGCERNKMRYSSSHQFLLTHPVWDVSSYCRNHRNYPRFLLTHPVWDVTLYIVYYSLSIPIYHEMDL